MAIVVLGLRRVAAVMSKFGVWTDKMPGQIEPTSPYRARPGRMFHAIERRRSPIMLAHRLGRLLICRCQHVATNIGLTVREPQLS